MMLELIFGGSASGKSEVAEQRLLLTTAKNKYYIATMKIWDEECKKKIYRHQKMRKKKGFLTVECPKKLSEVRIMPHSAVLLECMGNLLTNELFDQDGTNDKAQTEILAGIHRLRLLADDVIIVSNDVFRDGYSYDPQTDNYIRILSDINQQIAAIADRVTEVVCGISIKIK